MRTFVVVSRSMPSPRHQRSRTRLLPDRLRALELLGSCKDGGPEGILRARRFAFRVKGRRFQASRLSGAGEASRARGPLSSMAESVGSIASTSRPTWPPYAMRRRSQCAYPRLRHPHASVLVSAGYSLPIVAHGCALRACAQRSVTCRGHVGSILADKKLGSVVPSRGRP